MRFEASSSRSKIRALGICLVSLALPLVLGSCKGGSSSSSSSARIPINTAAGWSDSPFISGDGQRLYFMYSRYDFGPWFISGGAQPPVPSGPDRAGLHHSANPFDESDIYVATRNPDGTWSEAVNLGLNGAYGDSGGMEINGGNTFVWLQGSGTAGNIVMANRNPDGTWGTPVDPGPAINDHSAAGVQDNPHLTADGKALWFTSNRATGLGGRDIWFSSNSSGSWSAPANVGAPGLCLAGKPPVLQCMPVARASAAYSGQLYCVFELRFFAASIRAITLANWAFTRMSLTNPSSL